VEINLYGRTHVVVMTWVRPELNLRAQGRRELRTQKNSPKDSPTGCLLGLGYEPDHSWSGGGDCHAPARAPALAMTLMCGRHKGRTRVVVMTWVRPELNLRAHGRRELCTLKNSPTGCLMGLGYEPDHSWSGGENCRAPARAPALARTIVTKG
jgi:hypothetical protein